MIKMVKYQNLGFNSEDKYYEHFVNTLLPTNHDFNFFVDWDKVFGNIEENSVPIYILNSLIEKPENEIENEFRKILENYPDVVPILPSILAIRLTKKNKNVGIFDSIYKEYSFDRNNYNIEDLIEFSKETGLLDLFGKIKNLYAYLVGTEVGLDTNARKNRSGIVFENNIEDFLNENLKNKAGYTFHSQEFVHGIDRSKRADFVISKNGVQKIVIECNFYNSTGSKPIEVAHAYSELQQQLNKQGLLFIWVTDGLGWKTSMLKTLRDTSPNIDYLLNYTIFVKKFNEILELSNDLKQKQHQEYF